LKGVSTEKQTFVGIEISTSEASAILAPKSWSEFILSR
jgi:hypothetical protein